MKRYAVVEINHEKHRKSMSDPILEAGSLDKLADRIAAKTGRSRDDPLWPDEGDFAGGGLL